MIFVRLSASEYVADGWDLEQTVALSTELKRVGVDLPQFAMQESQILEQELRLATRQPQARTGNLQASIITGKGVEALMGSFDTVMA